MKKTIIALMTLAGVVTAAEQFETSKSITLSAASALGSHTASFKWTDIKAKDTAENQLTSLLGEEGYSVLTTNDSWYYFSAGPNEASDEADYSYANSSHTLVKGTGNATILTYTLDVSELFSSSFSTGYSQTITSLTFSGTTSVLGDCYYTAFAISDEGVVNCLTADGINNVKANVSFEAENVKLSATDKILVLYRQGNDTATTISGLKIDAIGTAVLIPEPTTATLSLLALAGLAARRRRR